MDTKLNNNCAIIIFGATGDLTKRKLIPALYRLMANNTLTNFIVLGAAREQISIDNILENSQKFITDYDDSLWQQFKNHFYYQQLNFTKKDDYIALNTYLQKLEKQHNLSGNRILYCASAASFFATITEHCAQSQVAIRHTIDHKIWHRFVYEKPFGHDYVSAHNINESIAAFFDEHQIYRIDHYLSKELVSNILLMRFANSFFEPLWNNTYIDQVQIILSEQIGIDDRGAYYDAYGALCDVVQNHVLELLALVAMETPHKLTADFIRAQRAKVLERTIAIDGYLGQYNGYQMHKGIKNDSTTETFAALCLMVDTPRWHNVPFYIKTGKKLDKKETTIYIKFKPPINFLLKSCPTESNWLTIKIVPDATFSLSLNIKKPGKKNELLSVPMEFCHSCIFGERAPEEAYEILFTQIMAGEQETSVRFDEIEYAWRIIDMLRTKKIPLYHYDQGSSGPQKTNDFEQKHTMKWRS